MEFQIPADITSQQIKRIQKLALKAYQTLECTGMARVDFFLHTHTQKIYLNEINTLPGFTSQSMYPKLWHATNLSYPNLLDKLIQLALH